MPGPRKPRLSRADWKVINEALGFMLAGEVDADTEEESQAKILRLEAAKAKVETRLS